MAVPPIRSPEGNQSNGHYWKQHKHSSASHLGATKVTGKKTASLHLLRKMWPPGELVDVRCSLESLQSVYINQLLLPKVRSARCSWLLAFGGWFEEHVFLCSSIVLPPIPQFWAHLFLLWMGDFQVLIRKSWWFWSASWAFCLKAQYLRHTLLST